MSAAMQGVTLVDLSSELLDNILRQLGLAPRAHCAAASTCTALRCRYVGGATSILPRLFEAGHREVPIGLRAQLRELGVLRGHCRRVNSASFSPDGQKIVSASEDCSVRIWDVVKGECVFRLRRFGHSSRVTSASFSLDGLKVVSGSGDQTVRIWDAVTGECEQTLEGHSDYVNSASFSPDCLKVVSGSWD